MSWGSSGVYTRSATNFLFSLTNGFRHDLKSAYSYLHAQVNARSYGPAFGGGNDFGINSGMHVGMCNVGNTYACRVGADTWATSCENGGDCICQHDFCGAVSATVTEEGKALRRSLTCVDL